MCSEKAHKAIKMRGRSQEEIVARISSIPDTPFFAHAESFSEDSSSMYNVVIRYRYKENLDAIRDFYLTEMERAGWSLIMQVNADDIVLTFDRPDLIAVIEIRPKEQSYSIALGRKINF